MLIGVFEFFTFLKTSPLYRAYPNFIIALSISFITTTIGDARALSLVARLNADGTLLFQTHQTEGQN